MTDRDEHNDPGAIEGAAQRLFRQEQLRKTVFWLADKQELGLAEEDIRSTLVRVRLPDSGIFRRPGGAAVGISVGDKDPTDPVFGSDFDSVDSLFWRTDVDPTDLARRPSGPP
jgi:hypothetical protein